MMIGNYTEIDVLTVSRQNHMQIILKDSIICSRVKILHLCAVLLQTSLFALVRLSRQT